MGCSPLEDEVWPSAPIDINVRIKISMLLRVIRFRLSPYRQSLRVSRAASPLSSAVRFNLTVTRSTLLRLRRPPTFAGAFHQYQQAADHSPGHPIPKTNSSNYRWLFSPQPFA